MAKFQVRMSQTVIEEATIEVEAATWQEAAQIARGMGEEGKVDWTFWEQFSGPEIDDVMPAEGFTG